MARQDRTTDDRNDPWRDRRDDRPRHAGLQAPLGPPPVPMWGSMYAADPYREMHYDPDPYRPGYQGDDGWRRREMARWQEDGGRGSARGFFDRATDEVASWFGDEEAERRREADHSGRGPRGYVRSDARIEEEVNERLTDDPYLDASDVAVRVSDREVTLEGIVDSRDDKRRAEDCVDSVSGVEHVQNNLRLRDRQPPLSGLTPKNVAG